MPVSNWDTRKYEDINCFYYGCKDIDDVKRRLATALRMIGSYSGAFPELCGMQTQQCVCQQILWGKVFTPNLGALQALVKSYLTMIQNSVQNIKYTQSIDLTIQNYWD